MINIPDKFEKLDYFNNDIYHNRLDYLDIYKVGYKIDKVEAGREIVNCKPSVALLLTCAKHHKVLMCRQFRAPIYFATRNMHDAWIYECPAGICDNTNILPSHVAYKELVEETGINPYNINIENNRWDKGIRLPISFVYKYYTSPGFTNEQHMLFHLDIEDVIEPLSNGLLSEGELIVSKWLSYGQIYDILRGISDPQGNLHKIIDGKTQRLCRWWLSDIQ